VSCESIYAESCVTVSLGQFVTSFDHMLAGDPAAALYCRCARRTAQYRCPGCNVPYCGVDCYKVSGWARCTREAFHLLPLHLQLRGPLPCPCVHSDSRWKVY
jgi:hypothetical protein